MTSGRAVRVVVLIASMVGAAAAHAGERLTVHLGPRATDGASALATLGQREEATLAAWACRDEQGFREAVAHGRRSGDWPIMHLVAKAGWAASFSEPCLRSVQLPPKDGGAPWGPESLRRHTDASSREYEALYGPACRDAVRPGNLFGPDGTYATVALSPACLVAQVRTVIVDPALGPWKIEGGRRIPRYPGTNATLLPCLTDWLPGRGIMVAGAEGDWDMGVIEYTRLARLLEQAIAVDAVVTGDARRALDKIDRELLTLRGGPADEAYDLVFSCGNKTNSFGTADDYVEDDDRYDEEQRRAVSGENPDEDSFWEKLWKFLRVLLVLAAIAFVAGALLGALTGGAALAGGLAGAAAVTTAVVLVAVWTTLWVAGIEETENHLLMQNTSKYLKNKRMMEELRDAGNRDGFAEVVEDNEAVRAWLLNRMQRIVEDDFVEYNSKPYARLSHMAILNLIDDACRSGWRWERLVDVGCDERDAAVVTAASAVYDLSAAKVALGSSQGRRLVTFRRLAKENLAFRDGLDGAAPKRFLEFGSGADHLLGALQYWTGDTRHGPEGNASYDSVSQMLWYATSRRDERDGLPAYRPHSLVLDLALRKPAIFEQSYNHDGHERYAGGPGWLLSAGGDAAGYGQGLRFNFGWLGLAGVHFTVAMSFEADDLGVGVPTALFADGIAARRDTYREILRFEGNRDVLDPDAMPRLESFSDNRCVAGSFACGMRLEIPEAIRACLIPAVDTGWGINLSFLSSAACPEFWNADEGTDTDFHLAVWHATCRARGAQPGCDERGWGFVEIAQRSRFPTLQAYAEAYVAANRDRFRTWNASYGLDELEFWSVTQNRLIRFTPHNEDFDADCRACGTFVRHEGGARFTIRHPAVAGNILIDLDDADAPIRRGEGGVQLDEVP